MKKNLIFAFSIVILAGVGTMLTCNLQHSLPDVQEVKKVIAAETKASKVVVNALTKEKVKLARKLGSEKEILKSVTTIQGEQMASVTQKAKQAKAVFNQAKLDTALVTSTCDSLANEALNLLATINEKDSLATNTFSTYDSLLCNADSTIYVLNNTNVSQLERLNALTNQLTKAEKQNSKALHKVAFAKTASAMLVGITATLATVLYLKHTN